MTKKILECDIFFEEEVLEDNEIPRFEDILEEILDLFSKLKEFDNWNDVYFWLAHNMFFYFWSNTIYLFDNEAKNLLNSGIYDKWRQFQDIISKWNTDFPLEFVLGVSFLIWKGKEELLIYLKKLERNFKNTSSSELITKLIKFISLGQLSIDIFNGQDQGLAIKLSIATLIMKYGVSDDCKNALSLLNPIISNKWDQIFTKDNRMVKDSIIRDWLSAKFIQIILIKKSEQNVINAKELPFFTLSPREFERLIFWIFKSDNNWTDVQWRGAAGREKGKDILAKRKESGRNWIIQAKRERNFSRKDLNKEYIKVKDEIKEYNAEGYIVCTAKNASDDLRKAGEELQKKNNHIVKIWDSEDLSFIIKNSNSLLHEFFNY
ncbi:MAG: restriction endonuclease [Promethearchaeota archaeon]